ncbi:DNA-directed RNA polymerases I and III subunit RPAC1 [Astathelohania contejeani]|uniref:DNA-directed RNA polymerases I and III subunit RPAC1 n=1 Tax=Astathelohania contejeani TaxID=164912 RepID=A0ABQ7HWK5_9MICR|nr:DNA-directed RNA polymerases I and III subunit RPAC1 [Thelohania contejeani]
MMNLQRENIIEANQPTTPTLDELISNIKIEIKEHTAKNLEFDLINADCALANSLRRILISEIPTMAIERVNVKNNTGVLPDETIAHRLGLIPVITDPDQFQFLSDELDETNTIKFVLKVKNNSGKIMMVSSDIIKWIPIGEQASRIQAPSLMPGITVTKLAPGQELDMEMYCTKNVGTVHAKWSPVCTATYRTFPVIDIVEEIVDEEADKLVGCFAPGVIGIRKEKGRRIAYVSNSRLDRTNREVLRHSEFDEKVILRKKYNHFIFNIETVFLDPLVVLKKGIFILIKKCESLRNELIK